MKNVTRAFVVILALTGASAAAHLSAATQQSSSRLILAKASVWPVPTCPPGDPDGCGIRGPNPPNPNIGAPANR